MANQETSTPIGDTHLFRANASSTSIDPWRNFSDSENDMVYYYYILVEALKNTFNNKASVTFELKDITLVASLIELIEVLKNKFSPDNTFYKCKLEEIDKLNQHLIDGDKDPIDGDTSYAEQLGYSRLIITRLSLANNAVDSVHLKLKQIKPIIDAINRSNNPSDTINRLVLDHVINLMNMIASYASSSMNNRLDSGQYPNLNRLNDLQESNLKLHKEFISWAIHQDDATLFASTLKAHGDILWSRLHCASNREDDLLKHTIQTLQTRINNCYNNPTVRQVK